MSYIRYRFWHYLQLFIVLALLFLSSLNLPLLSVLSMPSILAFGLVYSPFFKGYKKLMAKTNFLPSLLTITVFSLTFFYTCYSYELYSEQNLRYSLFVPIFVPISYAVGFMIDYLRLPYWPFNLILVLCFLIGGGVSFVYLSINQVTNYSLDSFLILNRKVPDIWYAMFLGTKELINGPSLDLHSILGVSLLPVIVMAIFLICKFKKRSFLYLFIAVFLSLTFCTALYSVVSLQGRTPIVALVVTVISSMLFWIAKSQDKNKFIKMIFITFFGIIILLNFSYLYEHVINSLYKHKIFIRFEEVGIESSRYELWKIMLQGLFDYPLGGRKINLGTENYAHNIWLDVAYDAGLLPMVLLIFFHALHVKPFLRVLSSDLPELILGFFVCLGVAFCLAFIGTPVIQASVIYFSESCFFLGLLTRLSADLKTLTKDEAKYKKVV